MTQHPEGRKATRLGAGHDHTDRRLDLHEERPGKEKSHCQRRSRECPESAWSLELVAEPTHERSETDGHRVDEGKGDDLKPLLGPIERKDDSAENPIASRESEDEENP